MPEPCEIHYERSPGAAKQPFLAQYHPRANCRTLLQTIVHDHLETMLLEAQNRSEHGYGYPYFIEKNFRNYDVCGCLSRGFSRIRCESCGYERLLAYSCKSKTCPSCHSRRMMDLSIHLVNQVLPKVPYRQWTLTFPRPIRFLMARDKKLLSKLFGIAMRSIFIWQRKQVKNEGFENVYPGSVTLIQNSGSAINLHYHAHSIVLDGLFVGNKEEELSFIELQPTTQDVEDILEKLIRKVEKVLIKYQEEHADDEPSSYDHLLEKAVKASQAYHVDSNPEEETFKPNITSRCAFQSGFSLHANTFVNAKDRKGLARLIRYGARLPFSQKQLSRLDNGDVCYTLKKPWGPHGLTQIVLPPVDFLHRLAALIPQPYLNMTRYYGILAPNSNRRQEVCPRWIKMGHAFTRPASKPNPKKSEGETTHTYLLKTSSQTSKQAASLQNICETMLAKKEPEEAQISYPVRVNARIPWAELAKFTFIEDLKICKKCGGTMTLIAAITVASVIKKILDHLKLPTDFSEPCPAKLAAQVVFDYDIDQSIDDANEWGNQDNAVASSRGPPQGVKMKS